MEQGCDAYQELILVLKAKSCMQHCTKNTTLDKGVYFLNTQWIIYMDSNHSYQYPCD